ncbi:helicase associated domain-containing protein [Arthrobacter sp. R4]|uniref:helicase associated domain-containing protein n=1 Tax=Arthrobacter sp. R4 TaxID=644417 RepID=UPI003ED919A9
MATKRWNAAPEAEWVLMYRRGLSRGRIAELTGAPLRTVGYHLTVARKLHPGLQTEHEGATRKKPRRETGQGMERLAQLIATVQASGRYPSTKSVNRDERTLATWLNRRRREAREGTLPSAFLEGLSVLPGWQGLPRVIGDEARWQERLTALVEYRGSGLDWPRHKSAIEGPEHDLGVWLHTQRYKARRGELDPTKGATLDTRLPGWRSGRARGRKPMGIPEANSGGPEPGVQPTRADARTPACYPFER